MSANGRRSSLHWSLSLGRRSNCGWPQPSSIGRFHGSGDRLVPSSLGSTRLSESRRLRLALVQDLPRSLGIFRADHDLVRSRYAQTVAGPGSVVGQPRQATDPRVAQNRAEQLRFGFGTGNLNCDKLVDRPMLTKPEAAVRADKDQQASTDRGDVIGGDSTYCLQMAEL